MAAAELKTLGRYNIERVLGKGAMGVVYEGVDPRLNRRVAIKTILKHNLDDDTAKDFAMRFVREAQAVARLNHPNIVQVYDFGEEQNVAYLVMEFIRGKELKNFFDANERFDLKEAVRIMGELCEALEFAHQAGIVHRDIKPANVMIDSQARTKLTDFGVARIQDTDKTSVERTQAGTMVGTPAYMSPEQITGGTIDKRSDVFSAGIILYQFLTGEKPFTGGGAWTIAKKIIQEDPPPPSSVNNAVTPLFDAVVNKALAKNPDERFQSAKDLALALRRALEGKVDEDDSDRTVVGGAPAPAMSPRPSAAMAAPESTKSGQTTTGGGNQEVELEFWRAIKDGNDPDDFELYVQQFPTGIYAALAKRKIAKLRGIPLDDTSVKAKEAEKKEAEEAAQREAQAKAKLADEKAKLEAELKRKDEEYKKREAEAEAKRLEAEKKAKEEAAAFAEKTKAEAAAERERVRQEAEKAKQEAAAERERTKKEAAALAEKAKQEAAAELAKREAEYKKREAEAAALRVKQEAEAKVQREAELKARQDAEAKARKEAEARAKKDAEDRAKREAEFKKREAELKAREADATLLAGGKKKSSPVMPIAVGLVVAAIAGGAWFAFAPDEGEATKQLKAMQQQLAEAKQKAAELEKAKKAEEQSRLALEKARADEAAARKAGDAKKEKELAELRVKAEAEQRKTADATKQASAEARKSEDAAQKAKLAAEKVEKEKGAKLAAEKAAQERAERQAAEKALIAKQQADIKAAQDKIAAAERAAQERIAAAEKAAQEAEQKAKLASAGAAPSSGEALFQQASALEKEGKGNEAVRAYTRAARAGNGKAAKRLGEIYDKGLVGVSRDYAESLKWYNAARVLGEDVPMAKSRQ